MFKRRGGLAAGALGITIALLPGVGPAQDLDVIMALPAQTLTFTSAFVAEDLGFYKQEGLKVSTRNLVGVAAPNAVLAGSADFTVGTGPVFLRAAAQGQRFLAIANLVDRPMVELVLRKDVADAAKITEATPFAERARALKGKTIAIQGVGSIIHAWMRLVASRGGLDPEKDVTIAPMNPPAMLPALESRQVDGYATSMPFTTQAVLGGRAIMLASAANGRDAPDLLPFAYGLLYTRPEVCRDKRELCVRMARAFAGAARLIQDKPDEVFEKVLRKRFDKMDPALLAAAWQLTQRAHARDIRVTVPQLENSQKVSLEARLLEPKAALTSYDGLYTDAFLK
jgi:ABC-type nitrate/sulfonate/bicarbonate transport system substrate-binding protein